MKSARLSQLGHRTVWVLGAALLFAQNAAQACPGCKQNTDGPNAVPLNGDSIGFGLSIFFMIFMIFAVLGGLGFMMYRSCRVLALRDAMEEGAFQAKETVEAVPSVGVMQPQPA